MALIDHLPVVDEWVASNKMPFVMRNLFRQTVVEALGADLLLGRLR